MPEADRKLRIAVVTLGRRGGEAVYALEVTKALAKLVEVIAVIPKQIYNLSAWHQSGARLLEIDTYDNLKTFIFSSLNLWRHLDLKRSLTQFKPDVIYFPSLNYWTPLVGLLMPKVPKVLTLHTPCILGIDKVFYFLARRQASRFILLAKNLLDTLISMGVPSDKIDVIPHGEFSYYVRAGGVLPAHHDKKPTVLFFGRIMPYKRLDTLLKAFPIIKQKVKDAELLIVGEGNLSPYAGLLRGLSCVTAVNRFIADNEVANYFYRSTLLAAPRDSLGQSGVIPLAYACKLPVIASRGGAHDEQVEDGKTGLLVNSDDAEEFAEACVELLQDTKRAASMGEAGYRKAMSTENWDLISGLIYDSCVKAAK